MRNLLTLLLLLLGVAANAQSQIRKSAEAKANTAPKPIRTEAIAKLALDKGLREIDLGIYGGTLLMHAMSELAVWQKEPETLHQAIGLFGKFRTKEINGRGSFISYEAGGSGTAYLTYLKKSGTLASSEPSEICLMQRKHTPGTVLFRRDPVIGLMGQAFMSSQWMHYNPCLEKPATWKRFQGSWRHT